MHTFDKSASHHNQRDALRFATQIPPTQPANSHLLRDAGNTAIQLQPVAFPYRTHLQNQLGHTLPQYAYIDPSRQWLQHTPAITAGAHSFFTHTQPSLKVAAHEATHILQHQGKTRDTNLGAETHASIVAEALAAGKPAWNLIGMQGRTVDDHQVHGYTEYDTIAQLVDNWPAGVPLRVADNGESATDGEHLLYAEPAAIDATNRQLGTQGSGVHFTVNSETLSGPIPTGGGRKTLHRITPTFSATSGSRQWYTDCGVSACDVSAGRQDVAPRALYQDAAGYRRETRASSYPAGPQQSEFYRGEILAQMFPGSADPEADYAALSSAQRDIFDSQYGINEYAAPSVGEMFHAMRDESASRAGYNLHWAAVILRPGHDFVTLENFARPGCVGPDCFNEQWYFQTYGPPTRTGQTFHEQWGPRVGATTSDSMTVSATTGDLRADEVAQWLSQWPSANAAQQARMLSQFQSLSIRVRVVMDLTGDILGDDEVRLKVDAGGFHYTSATFTMIQNNVHDFIVPLSRIAAIPPQFEIRLQDDDSTVFGSDFQTMVSIDWPSPFRATRNTSTLGGGRYYVTVELNR